MESIITWLKSKISNKNIKFSSKECADIDEYFIRLNTLLNAMVAEEESLLKFFSSDDNDIVYLPTSYVETVRTVIINIYRKSDDPIEQGYMSEGNLDFTLRYVLQIYNDSFSREEAIFKKAAFILYNLISKHPFTDGNKRCGVIICNSFLEFNGYTLGTLPFRKSYDFITGVAKGDNQESDCETFIKKNVTALFLPEEVRKSIRQIFADLNLNNSKNEN